MNKKVEHDISIFPTTMQKKKKLKIYYLRWTFNNAMQFNDDKLLWNVHLKYVVVLKG